MSLIRICNYSFIYFSHILSWSSLWIIQDDTSRGKHHCKDLCLYLGKLIKKSQTPTKSEIWALVGVFYNEYFLFHIVRIQRMEKKKIWEASIDVGLCREEVWSRICCRRQSIKELYLYISTSSFVLGVVRSTGRKLYF